MSWLASISLAVLNSNLSESESRCPTLAGWAFALVNVRAVCAVVLTALAASKLVDVLQVIRAGSPGVPHHHLPVLVCESNRCRVYAFSRHSLILPEFNDQTHLPQEAVVWENQPSSPGQFRIAVSSLRSRQEKKNVFCPKCGVELPDDSQFCRKCGQPLNASPSATTAGVQQSPTFPVSKANWTGFKPTAKGRFDAKNLRSGQVALIVLGIMAFLIICGLLTDTSKPAAEQATVPSGPSTNFGNSAQRMSSATASTESTFRDAFISKEQSLMNKADSEAYPTKLVHPTVSANPDDKSVLNIECPKVEPTGGSGDGLCFGVYQVFKNNVALPNEARMADFDRVVIRSPHFYKVLVLRGEACSPSVFCDALVDSGKIEKLQ
jgi:hypothetical protein